MFNIGFGELAIICIVLIIAVGPERLPSMMKTLGKTIRTLRQASRDIRASTGIDELLREDFDLYSPPPPQRRPAYVPPAPDPVAPAPVSRQDPIELPASTDAAPAPAEPAPVTPQHGQETSQAALLGGATQGAVPQPAPVPGEADREPTGVWHPALNGASQAESPPAAQSPSESHEPSEPGPGPRPETPKQPGT